MLKTLRDEVFEANLALVEQGLVVLTWGNVSGLDREKGLVVIKPSGVAYADLKPSDLVVVDLDGKTVDGKLRPSSDTPTHLALYREWPEVGGIVHTHSACATAFAQAVRGIPPLGTTHADAFHGEVPVTTPLTKEAVDADYEKNTGRAILDAFQELQPLAIPAALAANHGPFAWGRTATEAVHAAVTLEETAKMALLTLTLNPDGPPLARHILDKHHFRKHGPGATYGQKF